MNLGLVRLQYMDGRQPRTQLVFGVAEEHLTHIVSFGGDYFRYLRRDGATTVYLQEQVSCLDMYKRLPQ
jgi:hypothetical protein